MEAEARQAKSRQCQVQQQIVTKLEKEIQALEARQAEIVVELERPETYEKQGAAVEINRELVAVQEQLAELTPRWESEATRLSEMESA